VAARCVGRMALMCLCCHQRTPHLSCSSPMGWGQEGPLQAGSAVAQLQRGGKVRGLRAGWLESVSGLLHTRDAGCAEPASLLTLARAASWALGCAFSTA